MKSGALDKRTAELEKAIYGDQHSEMKDVVLPEKTVFKISLNDNISSKTNLVGDPVEFTVQEDVKVGDILVLPRGSRGSGVVTKVSRPKSFGRSGKLDISFDQVFSLDDEPIPTVLGPEAKDKLKMEAAAVGASTIGALALGPVGLVGGFLLKAKMWNFLQDLNCIYKRRKMLPRKVLLPLPAHRTWYFAREWPSRLLPERQGVQWLLMPVLL